MSLLYGERLFNASLRALNAGDRAINVGLGRGNATERMVNEGLVVECFTMKPIKSRISEVTYREELFEEASVEPADFLWTSMTIEHVPNIGLFLNACRKALKPRGLFSIVAPTDRQDLLVDGHLNFFTPAHLIYNMVVAGWDCSDAQWYTENRDICLMVRRKDRPFVKLNYDGPDLSTLRPYFPCDLRPRNTDPWLPDRW